MYHYTLESWLALFTGFAILIMGLRVYWLDPESSTKRGFVVSCALLCVQNIFFFEMESSQSLEWVRKLRPWQESIWNLASAAILYTMWHYARDFTQRQPRSWEYYLYWVGLGATPIFVALEAFTAYGHGILVWQPNGWHVDLGSVDGYDLLRMGWVIMVYGLSVYLIYLPIRTAPHRRARYLRISLFVVYALIIVNSFYANYIAALFLGEPAVLNETLGIAVGSLFCGLMLTNLQLFVLSAGHALPNLLRTMTNWFVLIDGQFRIIELNGAIVKAVGGSLLFWEGKMITDLIPAGQWEEHAEQIQRLRKNEAHRFEFVFDSPEGSQYVLFECTALGELGSREQGYILVGTDWTARKQALQQTKSYAEELERSNKALTSFAHIASHDLKEPVRNIGSFAGLLRRRLAQPVAQDVDEYLQFIERNARHMNELIGRILEVSVLGQQQLEKEQVNLNKALTEVREQLHLRCEELGAVIRQEGMLPEVHGDATLLKQLFQDLIENALKFNESTPPQVLVVSRLEHPVNQWVIEIHDNGIGVPPAFQHQIFEMFKRLHTRKEFAGSGIGLAICQRIVELHDGELGVGHSSRLSGSVFSVHLPANGILKQDQ